MLYGLISYFGLYFYMYSHTYVQKNPKTTEKGCTVEKKERVFSFNIFIF